MRNFSGRFAVINAGIGKAICMPVDLLWVNSVEKLSTWSKIHCFGGALPLLACEIVDPGAICELHLLANVKLTGIFEFFNRWPFAVIRKFRSLSRNSMSSHSE